MILRRLSKLFLYANKNNRLSHVKPFLNIKTEFLRLTESTTRSVISHSTATKEETPEKSRQLHHTQYSVQYILNSADNYSIVKSSDINLEDETNFRSLKLLKDFLNSSEGNIAITEVEDCLKKELPTYGLLQIYKFIILVSQERNVENIVNLIGIFDSEICQRKFSKEDTLKILFLLKEQLPAHLNSKFYFSIKSVIKLCKGISNLSTQQMVLLFSCMKRLFNNFLQDNKFMIQLVLSNKISQFSADELSIIAEGLLRSRMSVSYEPLVSSTLSKMTQEVENLNDNSLRHLCTFLKLNIRLHNGEALLDFQQKIIPCVSKFNNYSIVHLATMGSFIKCMNPSLWEVLVENFKSNICNFTDASVERMVYATTAYNIKDDELLNMAVKHFEAKQDLDVDPRIMISFLFYLTHHEIYPENLLRLIYSEKFLPQDKIDLLTINEKRKYCFINCCLELDKTKPSFSLFNLEQKKRLYRVFSIYNNESLKKCFYSTSNIYMSLKEKYGENLVKLIKCVPHFEYGIVMRFDRNLQAQPVSIELGKNYSLKEALKDDHIWLFIVVHPTNKFMYNSETPGLEIQMRMRQIKSLGYKPVFIKQQNWMEQKYEKNEVNFLNNLIQKNLEMSEAHRRISMSEANE